MKIPSFDPITIFPRYCILKKSKSFRKVNKELQKAFCLSLLAIEIRVHTKSKSALRSTWWWAFFPAIYHFCYAIHHHRVF